MGMFASVRVSNEIDLPYFPEELDRDGMVWQSKRGIDKYGGPYRLTAEGRLEQKKQSYREKTDEEKQAEAEKWGFDSWDEYVAAYDEMEPGSGSITPDEIDWDPDEDGYDDAPPTFRPSEETLDKEWWADYNMHGTFEFHQLLKEDPISYKTETPPLGDEPIERVDEYALNVYLEYEARFDEGELTDISFMGQRIPDTDDPVQEALDQIEEWREWREENDG